MKIAVAGLGYVGLSLLVVLARCNEVTAVDAKWEKVRLVNMRKLLIKNKEIED